MRIVKDLIQGSDAWHAFRKLGVGASESSALVGMNPYKTPLDLFNEKTGRSFGVVENDAMRAGTAAEPIIRKAYEESVSKEYDTPCAIHDEYDCIRASFDGYCHEDGSIIEVKHSRSPKLSNTLCSLDLFKGEYPHYWCQCQHLMLMSAAPKCMLVTITNSSGMRTLEIPRDSDFIDKKLAPAILDFWVLVKNDILPELSGKDYEYLDDDEAIETAGQWIAINKDIKALQEQEKAFRSELIDMGNDGNMVVGNILKMTRVNTAGRVNTKKLYEEYNITPEDLNRFRNEQIGSYRFTTM